MDLILGAAGLVLVVGLAALMRRRRPQPSTAAVDEQLAAEHARPYVRIDVTPHRREP
jgi:hypothetical protein